MPFRSSIGKRLGETRMLNFLIDGTCLSTVPVLTNFQTCTNSQYHSFGFCSLLFHYHLQSWMWLVSDFGQDPSSYWSTFPLTQHSALSTQQPALSILNSIRKSQDALKVESFKAFGSCVWFPNFPTFLRPLRVVQEPSLSSAIALLKARSLDRLIDWPRARDRRQNTAWTSLPTFSQLWSFLSIVRLQWLTIYYEEKEYDWKQYRNLFSVAQ